MAVNLLATYRTPGEPRRRVRPSARAAGPGIARGRPLDGLDVDPGRLALVEAQLGGEETERVPLRLLVREHAGEDVAKPVAVAEERHRDVVGQRQIGEHVVHGAAGDGVEQREESHEEQLLAALLELHAGRDDLAEARADQRVHEELAGLLVREAGQGDHRGPLTHGILVEEGQRLPHRRDPVAEAEGDRIDVGHQLVRERRLTLDHVLEIAEVEIRPIDLAEQLQIALLDARDVAAREHERLGEEVALQVRVPQADRLVELGARLDLLGQRLDLAGGDEGGKRGLGAGVGAAEVHLDDVGEADQRVVPVVADHVVERDQVSALLQITAGVEDLVVLLDILEDLDHDAVLGQERGVALHQRVAREVDERALAAGEALEAKAEEAVGDDLDRRAVGVHPTEGVLEARAEQELVRVDLPMPVEDRLPRDKDLRLSLFGVHVRVIGGGVPKAHPARPGSRRDRVLGAAGFRPASYAKTAHEPGQQAGGEALDADRELAVNRDDHFAAATGDRADDDGGRPVGGHDEPRRRVAAGVGMMDAAIVDLMDLGIDESRTDQRDGDAVGRQLTIEGLSQRAHGKLAHRVRRAAWEADVAGDTAEDHETAVGELEVVESGVDGAEHTEDVGLELPAVVLES